VRGKKRRPATIGVPAMVSRETVCVIMVGLENHVKRASAQPLQVWKSLVVDVEHVLKTLEYANVTKTTGAVLVRTRSVALFIRLAVTMANVKKQVRTRDAATATRVHQVMPVR